MTEAHGGIRVVQLKARVGFLDNVTDERALCPRHSSSANSRCAIIEVPPDVGLLPEVVELVGREEAVEVHLVGYLGVLGYGSEVEEVGGESVASAYCVGISGTVEQAVHKRTVVDVAFHPFVVGRLDSRLMAKACHKSVLVVVHVVHVVLRCITGHLQLGVMAEQFLQFVFHRQDTADDDSRACVDGSCRVPEYLWESL